MKKSTSLIILALIVSNFINAQSTDRFIRIIGNSTKELKADNAKVYFSISEVKESKYNNSEAQTYKEVYNDVISQFEENGINSKSINESIENLSKNYRNDSKEFFVIIKYDELKKFQNIENPGFRIKNTKYLFKQANENLESELSLQAINDARKKAKTICQDIDKKVGKILNIEVKEGGFFSNNTESKNDNIMVTYKVTITFKLID